MGSPEDRPNGSDSPSSLTKLCTSLHTNTDKISADFGQSSDLVINFVTFENAGISLATVFIKEMADSKAVSSVSEVLTQLDRDYRKIKPDHFFNLLMSNIGTGRTTNTGVDFISLCKELLDGSTVIISDGFDYYLSIKMESNEGRAITEPTSQTNIKGPKDAFTENIDKNVYLIRKKLRNEALRVQDITIGTVTHTKVKLVYINGIAKKDIVDDLRSRVTEIDYDGILNSSYIEEIIKTDPHSIFPTSINSERPDNIIGGLLEGRVAIICDGTPFVLLAPALFSDFIHASDDYYENHYVASLMRLSRYIALLFTLIVPSFFVALITFHQEIIPTPLLISIAAQREGVPFPALFEVLVMDFTFELLREAGIRMPRAVGSAISIVGALVLGQAAVEAGFVTAATVIIISLTAISSFAITNYAMNNAVRFLRFAFLLLAGVLGLYGITMGLLILLLHLCKLKSASVPYLAPAAPYVPGGLKDMLIRAPFLKNKFRPTGISGTGTARTNGRNTMNPNVRKKAEMK